MTIEEYFWLVRIQLCSIIVNITEARHKLSPEQDIKLSVECNWTTDQMQ